MPQGGALGHNKAGWLAILIVENSHEGALSTVMRAKKAGEAGDYKPKKEAIKDQKTRRRGFGACIYHDFLLKRSSA